MDNESNRLFLHSLLESAFPDLTIYYRPSGNIILSYPCMVYEKKALEPSFANTQSYVVGVRFQATIISKLPGYSNSEKMFDLHGQGLIVASNDSYENNDLIHDVFTLYVNTV